MIDLINLVCCPICNNDLIRVGVKFNCINCGSDFREKEGILILISKKLEDELRS